MKQIQGARTINQSSLWPKPTNPIPDELKNNENIKVVNSFFQAYAKHDLDGIRSVMSEDVE